METAFPLIDKIKQYLAEGFNSLEFVKYLEILDELRKTTFRTKQHKVSFDTAIDDIENAIMSGSTTMIPKYLNVMESVLKADFAYAKLGGGRRRYSRKKSSGRKRRWTNRRRSTNRRRRRKTKRSRTKSRGRKR